MREIRILNLHRSYRLNARLVKRIVSRTLKFCKGSEGMELEFVFLDNKKIKALNKKYKGPDRATDVLSFGINRREFGLPFCGEIIISLDRARENSKLFGTEFNTETVLYIVHGILHLFGYNDLTADQRLRMSARESKILEYLCRKEDLSKVLTRRQKALFTS